MFDQDAPSKLCLLIFRDGESKFPQLLVLIIGVFARVLERSDRSAGVRFEGKRSIPCFIFSIVSGSV